MDTLEARADDSAGVADDRLGGADSRVADDDKAEGVDTNPAKTNTKLRQL